MKLLRTIIIVTMLFGILGLSVKADTSFKSKTVYANAKKTYSAITDSKNKKIYKNKAWYVTAKKITYSPKDSFVGYGMCFSPMIKNAGTYALAGGSRQWIKKGSDSPVYGEWNGKGKCGYYYLGVRLDTDFTGKYGTVKGLWNAR